MIRPPRRRRSAAFRPDAAALVRGACACIAVFLALGPGASSAAGISVRDDAGREVALAAPAKRVVTLAPFLTELAFSAGAGAQVVGVSAFSDYPPRARRLPEAASAAGVSREALAALHPDLVLAWADSLRPGEAARIAALGPAVYVARARTLADVPRLLRAIGTLTGHDAHAAAAAFDARIDALRRAHAGVRPVDVFLEIWHRPLTTISGRHFMNEALALCGARNVFADLPGVAPVVSWERLYALDPPVIVGVGPEARAAAFRAQWRAHPALAAVRARRLAYVDGDRLERPTARTPEGIAQLCAAIDRVRP